MAAPTVSVVIPCYNLGRFIGEAVDSVLAQTFQDFEILIVDDGSTEPETRELLAGFEAPRTRIISATNQGLPAAKNLGITQTTGRYICALDADDRLEPTLFEKSVAALERDESLAFVSHWLRAFGDEAWDWTPTRCDFPALLDRNTVNGSALVRRQAIEAVGGFDETMRDGCEDWDLWISLVERGFRGEIIPEVLFHYRRRAGSMSRIMMHSDGHPRLYRQLAGKHAASYRAHLGALLLRREDDISNLQRHIHDMELEYERWLAPELAKRRDDLAVLDRKARQPLEALEAERQQLLLEVGAQRESFKATRMKALRLDARANRAYEELDDIQRSWSWRLTAPLRAVYGRLPRKKKNPAPVRRTR